MLGVILLVVVIISLISLVGIFTLSLRKNTLSRLMLGMISFAAGSLLAAAFLDLIPEALEKARGEIVFGAVLLGILVSFAVEKFLYHYHCHTVHRCDHPHRIKPYAILNLVGDAIHNFLDGIVIAVAFITSYPVGISASIAVIAHEIPQEIGDFALLVKGGFTTRKALFYNFLTALTAIAGALFGYYFTSIDHLSAPLAGFAGGTFIYIAASDIIPELHHEEAAGKSALQFGLIIFGIALIYLVKIYFP